MVDLKKDLKIRDWELRYFCIFSALILFVAAFYFNTPKEIIFGEIEIFKSRDALITDYFELANYGAAFFNTGLMVIISMALIDISKIPYTGLTLAAIFINAGFALWGKNPVNIIPIIFGTWLYARMHRAPFKRYVYTALFSTCLGPFVTELVFVLPFPFGYNLVIATIIGIFIGFVLPPLSMHTASMHKGYSLFNVGFSAGILAFVMFCVLKSFGIESEQVFIWKAERNPVIIFGLLIYFLIAFIWGLILEKGKMRGLYKIMQHPGRAVADFVMREGSGSTLMNMGIMGIAAEIYILAVGADLSGPILGGLLTVFGFSAFGAHLRNYLPVLAGVSISTIFMVYDLKDPAMLIACLFVVGVAPIAGQFGPVVGMIAGMLHSAIVTCTSQMYGGLNLYNNGFSAGWVAIIMIPILESFMTRFENSRMRRRNK